MIDTNGRHLCSFTVHGKAEGKARPRFANGRTYTPTKTRAYADMVKGYAALAWRKEPTIAAITAMILDVRPVPACWPKAKRAEALAGKVFPTARPDTDNVQKAIFDALNGLVYRDDAQVVGVVYLKEYGTEPRVEVTIQEAA